MLFRSIGVSDHTPQSMMVPIVSTALGAAIIEKHLMLDGVKSEDSDFSLKPDEFALMVRGVKIAHESMKERKPSGSSRQMRRSLYAVADIKEGETLTEQNIRSIRPGYGASPSRLSKLLGTPSLRSYRRGDPITA